MVDGVLCIKRMHHYRGKKTRGPRKHFPVSITSIKAFISRQQTKRKRLSLRAYMTTLIKKGLYIATTLLQPVLLAALAYQSVSEYTARKRLNTLTWELAANDNKIADYLALVGPSLHRWRQLKDGLWHP
jgi:hypothetical protein